MAATITSAQRTRDAKGRLMADPKTESGNRVIPPRVAPTMQDSAPVTAPAPPRDPADILKSLSVADLAALKQALGLDSGPAPVDPTTDERLAEPVRFWNPRYQNERVMIPGRTRPLQFTGGALLVKTKHEYLAVKGMGSYILEGDDREEPYINPKTGKRSWNFKFYEADLLATNVP